MSEPFENRVTCCISDSFIYSICIKCRGAQERLRAGSEAAAQDPEELPVQLGRGAAPGIVQRSSGLGILHLDRCARLHLQLLMKDSSVQLVALKRAFVILLLRRHFMGAAG